MAKFVMTYNPLEIMNISKLAAFGSALLCSPLCAQTTGYNALFQVPTGKGSGYLQVADFNRDGNADILVDYYHSLVQYFGNGDGTFTEASRKEHPQGRYLLRSTIEDFNSDGKQRSTVQ